MNQTPHSAAVEPVVSPVDADPPTHPETRGIELIAEEERRGRARELFAVWAAPNVSVLNFTIGATLTLVLGLELWQALLVVLASQLLWIFPGIVAVSGPAAGTSGSVVQRAMYGIHGNRIVMAFFGWFISGIFLALNWVASSFMGAELLSRWGVVDHAAALVIVTIVVSLITVFVAVFGHALIVRSYMPVTVGLLIVFLLVVGFIASRIDWSFAQPEPLSGIALWSSISIGFAILASTPLSYSNSADIARYLPRSTRPSHIIAATALGGAIPCLLFTAVGALLGGAVDPASIDIGVEYALLEMIPAWLGPLFVLGVIVNTVALNGMTTYTASMALQAIGVPIKRIPSAVLIGLLGTVYTLVLVTSTNLLDAVNLLLQFLLIISAPTMAIYVTDIILRRNRYDSAGLFDDTRGGPFWYHGGFGTAGLVGLIAGGIATALFLSTDIWTGPLARALGEVDLSAPAGMIVASAVYMLLAAERVRKQARL